MMYNRQRVRGTGGSPLNIGILSFSHNNFLKGHRIGPRNSPPMGSESPIGNPGSATVWHIVLTYFQFLNTNTVMTIVDIAHEMA